MAVPNPGPPWAFRVCYAGDLSRDECQKKIGERFEILQINPSLDYEGGPATEIVFWHAVQDLP